MTEEGYETIDRLAARAKSGDRKAFSEIVQRMMNKVVALAHRMTGNRDASLDIAQDTFLAAWENLAEFRGDARFTTWLYRIAYNRGIDQIRREKRITMVPLEGELESSAVAGAEASVMHADLVAGVRRCLKELQKAREREALVLYYLSGKVLREIGDILGKSTGTAKNRVQSAQLKVRRCLERKGFDASSGDRFWTKRQGDEWLGLCLSPQMTEI